MGTGEKDEKAVGLWAPGGAFRVLSVARSAASSPSPSWDQSQL